jgi:hypothetical protein
MPIPGSSSAKILVPTIVGLLLCGLVASELPEILSLTDNTANDFTIRKASTPQSAPKVSAASYDSCQLNTKGFEYSEQVDRSAIFDGVNSTSSSLFILLCALRT